MGIFFFLEDFDCSSVISVRVRRPEKKKKKKKSSRSMFVLTIWKGLVFQPAVYTLLQTGSIFFFHRKRDGNHRKIKPA